MDSLYKVKELVKKHHTMLKSKIDLLEIVDIQWYHLIMLWNKKTEVDFVANSMHIFLRSVP